MTGSTLDKLAIAMCGMPRDARILIRLSSGELVNIDHVTSAYTSDDNSIRPSGGSLHLARYAIILVAEDGHARHLGNLTSNIF